MPAFAVALLALGLSAGIYGILSDHDNTAMCGALTVLTAVPLLIVHTVHNAQRLNAHQLAEAENAGYRRALDHVARGLLDQHTAPPNGGQPAGDGDEQAPGNVVTLRPHTSHSKRKAQ
ncbi:hypothetical protein [Streptomyces sp. CC224B]|uniref:hypothetical protein n=1 Tax=Streptomyces sp. CC224B TaxID=3044571 RepID=UPI0024A91985|nr:hypothetical protein [Streptomyces sp. CC224B]